MSEINHKEVLEQWSKIYLRNEYEDWKLEIDPSINQDFASIALFLDYRSSKEAGEQQDVYKGFQKAAFLVLDLIGVAIIDDPEAKTIKLTKKERDSERDKKLAKEICG